ncbi:MAG: sensor histidine kinase [Methylibium sp.]|uniref:sensor histidine kinase n=1 Tax=Methylibium sp. TaxID=2067992 RepID=UPI0017DDF39B|nr:sensor histidine kinase [Methylibium sp.]MBA3596308.1 sensor histidine kinase [Methylibium sp.]
MRATTAFKIATYLTLGVIGALFVTMSMLTLRMVKGVEQHSTDIDRAYAAIVETSQLATELAEIQRDECHAPWPRAPIGHAFAPVGSSPALAANAQGSAQGRASGPQWRAELQCLDQLVRTLRPDEPKPVALAAQQLTVLPAAIAGLADRAPTIGELTNLIDGMVQRQTLDVERGKAAETAGFRHLHDDAVLIGVIATVSGLLLLGLIRRSFAAQDEVAGKLAFTNEHLERSVRERTEELQAANEALSQHSARIEAAREEERLRIARDVHDELGSTLTALKLELSGTLGSGPIDGVHKPWSRRAATDMVDSALKSVQAVIAALRPFPLEQLGLLEALRWKARQFEQLTLTPCRLVLADGLPGISAAASTAAFRIVEEALTNVARHAGARKVKLFVRVEDGRLVIEVSDDGRGIANAELLDPCSFGLLSMRERARSVGGEVSIAAPAGRGTTVRLSLPPA